jgi:hypothetical protein
MNWRAFVGVFDRSNSQRLCKRLGVIGIGLIAILNKLVVARGSKTLTETASSLINLCNQVE